MNDTLEELQSIVKEESELDGAALALQDRVAVFVDNLQRLPGWGTLRLSACSPIPLLFPLRVSRPDILETKGSN